MCRVLACGLVAQAPFFFIIWMPYTNFAAEYRSVRLAALIRYTR